MDEARLAGMGSVSYPGLQRGLMLAWVLLAAAVPLASSPVSFSLKFPDSPTSHHNKYLS